MCAAVPAAATVQQEISDYMQRLRDHPQEVMGEMPARRHGAHRAASPFTPEQVKSGDYVSLKAQQREKLLRASTVSRRAQAASASQEEAAALVDGGASVITNLWRLDAEVPREYTLPTQSWSDTYWPLYRGSTAWRYGDDGLAATRPRKWSDFYEYSQEHPVGTYNTTEKASDLSPSEKYDRIVGDADGYLTQHAWNSGKPYADRNNGSVETWMGLCHGWAPAAYMLPRPVRTISVTSPSGEEVLMYPSDVKALGTMLWANVQFPTRFIGGRCNKKAADLETDESNGRVKDQDCFDTNPGTLHIAVANQLGVSHRSLVIDAHVRLRGVEPARALVQAGVLQREDVQAGGDPAGGDDPAGEPHGGQVCGVPQRPDDAHCGGADGDVVPPGDGADAGRGGQRGERLRDDGAVLLRPGAGRGG